MADRNKAVVVGTIVPGANMNIKHWMDCIRKTYEAPDQYGKKKSVEFDVHETFIDFWVS